MLLNVGGVSFEIAPLLSNTSWSKSNRSDGNNPNSWK